MHNAGRVGFVVRGEYSGLETYNFLDVVYYNYSSYVAKKETSGNIPAENNEFWQILLKGALFSVSGVKGESETEYRTGDVNLTAGDIGALPVSGGILSSENGKILTLKRKNQTGGIEVLFSNEAKEIMSLLVNVLEEKGQFTLHDRIIASDIFSVSTKKRKVYDYKTDELKEIIVEGEALPITGGTLQNSNKAILNIKRSSEADVSIGFENLKQVLGDVGFNVYKELVATDKNGTIKKVLLNGDALPATGGTIESNAFPMLKLKSVGGNKIAAFDLIPEQDKEIKLRVQSGYDAGKDNASFDFFEINDGDVQQLCTLTKNGCKVFDPVTNTLKRIIVEGETLPLNGGSLSSEKSEILTLHRNSDAAAKLKFENINGDIGAIEFSKNGSFQIWDKEGNIFVQLNPQYAQVIRNGIKKRVLIEGEALSTSGGNITDSKRNVLYLNNTAENASDVEIIFQVNNVDKMALSGRDNGGIGVYDFVNKQTLLEATNSMFRYKGKNVLVEGDTAQLAADIAYIAMESGVDIYE